MRNFLVKIKSKITINLILTIILLTSNRRKPFRLHEASCKDHKDTDKDYNFNVHILVIINKRIIIKLYI